MMTEHDVTEPPLKQGTLQACLLLGAVSLACRVLMAWRIPVTFWEAFVWERGRHLSWGYYGHPPMAAWLASLFDTILPTQVALAFRLPSLLAGMVSLWLLYRTALVLFGDSGIAGRSVLLALCLPAFWLTGALAVPPAPLTLFHMLFLWLFALAVQTERGRYWYMAGIALGLSLLCSLTALPTVLGCLAFLVASPRHRQWLRRPHPYVALLLALLVFSPQVYWEYSEDWPTLRLFIWHFPQLERGFRIFQALEFLGEQFANTGPFLLVPLLGILAVPSRRLPEKWRTGYLLARCQCGVFLAVHLAVNLVAESHPEWTMLAYPSAAIALAALATCSPKHLLARHLVPLCALTACMLIALAVFASADFPRLCRLSGKLLGPGWDRKVTKLNTRLYGWRALSAKLPPILDREAAEGHELLFTDDPKRATMLAFYCRDRTVINLRPWMLPALRNDDWQYFHIPWRTITGRNGLFVTSADMEPLGDSWRKLFDRAEELAPIDVWSEATRGQRYRIFRVWGLRPEPLPPPFPWSITR